MDRRNFIKTAGTLAGASIINPKIYSKSFLALTEKAKKKPNILYIMTDQQSYNMMSCMGNKWLSTPNMDSIAQRGYRFNKNYCSNPVCMPSRFSLLTGHYASEVGVKENTTIANKKKTKEIVAKDSIGHVFRNAGYQTL